MKTTLGCSLLLIFFVSACLSTPLIRQRRRMVVALPEDHLNITEVINYYNYSVQTYQVETEDGYILSIQRIPCARFEKSCDYSSKPPVLLQHGLVDSAHTWVNNLPHQSLGFILADQGFDVWLTNSRGNTYSRVHKRYTPHQKEFWAFTWDDMARYDLPAFIDFVLNVTHKPSLGYVGHSQGTEMAFARFNDNDRLAHRVNSVVALAPVAFLGHVRTFIHTLAKHPKLLDFILSFTGHGQFAPSSKLISWLSEVFCSKKALTPVCTNIVFYIAGFDLTNMNQTRLSVYLSHLPAGTSVRNLIHYCQGVNSDKFQKYDFGERGNMEHYGQKTPPEYSVSNFTIPLAIISGGNDSLAPPADVARLMQILPKDSVKFYKMLPYYNHLDFVWGEDSDKAIYPDVVAFLRKYATLNLR